MRSWKRNRAGGRRWANGASHLPRCAFVSVRFHRRPLRRSARGSSSGLTKSPCSAEPAFVLYHRRSQKINKFPDYFCFFLQLFNLNVGSCKFFFYSFNVQIRPSLWPAKSIKMRLPVCRINGRILNWISTMDHLSISGINSYVGNRLSRIIRPSEKDNISWSCFFW